MSSITLAPSVAPEADIRDVTWLADALTARATQEGWQPQQWEAAQTVLECLITDTVGPEAPRPIFALYALTLCKDSISA